MSDDLPEIVVLNDGLATRNLPVPAASPWAGFPERPDKVWVVATHPDGSLFAIEIPRPGRITLDSEREVHEGDDGMPFWLRDRVIPDLGPLKLRVTIDGFDADLRPGEPRPDPLFSIRIYPAGTLNL